MVRRVSGVGVEARVKTSVIPGRDDDSEMMRGEGLEGEKRVDVPSPTSL